jgi:hypothetical protein
VEKITWNRASVMAWLADYSKATAEFNRMEPAEKIEVLRIIRATYPEDHRQLAAIDVQIDRIRKSIPA